MGSHQLLCLAGLVIESWPSPSTIVQAQRYALSVVLLRATAMPCDSSPYDAYHVIPLDDLREHDCNEDCWCRPIEDEGVYIHNSMDGREKFEIGERKPS